MKLPTRPTAALVAPSIALALAGCPGGPAGAGGASASTGTVTGILESYAGVPVPNSPVILYLKPPFTLGTASPAVTQVATPDLVTTTDAAGRFSLTPVPAGTRTLYLGSGAALPFPHTLAGGEVENVGTLVLGRPSNPPVGGFGTLQGTVQASPPLQGDILVGLAGTELVTAADAQGNYQLTYVPAGTASVFAYSPASASLLATGSVTIGAGVVTTAPVLRLGP